MSKRQKVAIVGAGASGLPSIRHALLYGLDVTCFEGSGHCGGLWKFKPEETDESSVMKSTVINTSKELTAFSDFPPPPEMANYMHNTALYRYFQLYAEHYDLLKYIKFYHKVLDVRRSSSYAEDGTWDVTYTYQDGEKHTDRFDGVLMCSGHHTIPHWPKPFPGQERFRGSIIHSHSYKDHRGYEDKVVVVVGIGNSGVDVAVELSKIAKHVYLVTRRGSWIVNRVYDYGEPFDMALSNRFNATLQQLMPIWLQNTVIERKLNQRFDHFRYGLKPAHRFYSAHPTINDELPNRLACGTVKIKPNIRRFTEGSIEFQDGSVVDNVDNVIFSTGYTFNCNLVEGGEVIPVDHNQVDLYKYMFPLQTTDHNTLAVIGMIQPLGSVMPISEMQARVFFENFVGTHKLPSKAEMDKDILEKREVMRERYVKSERHTVQVDYVPYMDELACQIGCYPKLTEIFKQDPILAVKLFFAPVVPYNYRILGPHPWQGAKHAIETVDERVFRGTNSGPYQPDYTIYYNLVLCLAALFVIILLI